MMNRRKFITQVAGTCAVLALTPNLVLGNNLLKPVFINEYPDGLKDFLMNVQEMIVNVLDAFRWEFKDDVTRASIVAVLSTEMQMLQTLKLIQDYLVVCDKTNNSVSLPLTVDVEFKLSPCRVYKMRGVLEGSFVNVIVWKDLQRLQNTSFRIGGY